MRGELQMEGSPDVSPRVTYDFGMGWSRVCRVIIFGMDALY